MRTLCRMVVAAALFVTLPTAHAQTPPVRAVTFDDVIKQVKAGAGPADILEGCQVVFTLTADQKAELVKAGAPSALIDALQTKRMNIGDVTNFVVILDCSGSMKDEIGKGQTKMDAAKKVVGELFKAIPNNRNLAFIVYGHDAALECKAVKVVRPLGPVTDDARKELAEALAGFSPKGHTPIAAALKAAGEVLAKSEAGTMSQVVVITDGVETCHGDPAAEAEALSKVKGVRAVEVIGVGLNKDEKEAVAVIAKRGRGKFYDADSAANLKKAVAKAAVVDGLGADQDGFTPLTGDGVWMIHKGNPNTWTISEDGVFTNRGGRGGWLMTVREYADYELRLEVKGEKGFDTGIAFRNSLDTDPSFEGNQIQFTDEALSKKWPAAVRSGGIHDVVAPAKEGVAKPLGEWNAITIVAKGRQLTVTVNDTTVLDTDLGDHKKRVTEKAGGMFLHPDLLREKGHIGLQSWDGKMSYRNVRVKALVEPAKAAPKDDPKPAKADPEKGATDGKPVKFEPKQVFVLKGHTSDIACVAYSPDGGLLATASEDNSVRIWDMKTGERTQRIPNKEQAHAVEFSPDGKTIAVGNRGKRVVLYDVKTGDPTGPKFDRAGDNTDEGGIHLIRWMPDGKRLAAICWDKWGDTYRDVQMFDVETGKAMGVFSGHKANVQNMAVSPDGEKLATVSFDSTIRLWDTKTFKELDSLKQHDGKVYGVTFSRDGKTLVTSGADATVVRWDVKSGNPIKPVMEVKKVDNGEFMAVRELPNGRIWATTNGSGHLVFDPKSGAVLAERPTDSNWGAQDRRVVHKVYQLSPDGKHYARATGGDVYIWDASAGFGEMPAK